MDIDVKQQESNLNSVRRKIQFQKQGAIKAAFELRDCFGVEK
jgi:hypothetical protein